MNLKSVIPFLDENTDIIKPEILGLTPIKPFQSFLGNISVDHVNVVSPTMKAQEMFCSSLTKSFDEIDNSSKLFSTDSSLWNNRLSYRSIHLMETALEVVLFKMYENADNLDTFLCSIVSLRTGIILTTILLKLEEAQPNNNQLTLTAKVHSLFEQIISIENEFEMDWNNIRQELESLRANESCEDYFKHCLRIAIERLSHNDSGLDESTQFDLSPYTGFKNDIVTFIPHPRPFLKAPKHSLIPLCDFGIDGDFHMAMFPTTFYNAQL